MDVQIVNYGGKHFDTPLPLIAIAKEADPDWPKKPA